VELSGPIFVDGLPLLKRVEDSKNGTTEYFYDEAKRCVRETNDKSAISEMRFKYKGNQQIETSFTQNPNFSLQGTRNNLDTNPQFYEYDILGRVSAIKSKNFVQKYKYFDQIVETTNRSLLETFPEDRLYREEFFDAKGNLTKIAYANKEVNEFTYDDKINPNSYNPSNNSGRPGGLPKNNVVGIKTVGSWVSGDYTLTYQYTYNRYNLPIKRTGNNGSVVTYTYYE
jgi:hypothetical protein